MTRSQTARTAPSPTVKAASSQASAPRDATPFGRPLDPADPRRGLAAALSAATRMIVTATESPEGLSGPTPCTEFTVEELIEHMIFVARRVATIGNGDHFVDTPGHTAGSAWDDAFSNEAQAIGAAWIDASKLGQTYQVPWGQAPGAAPVVEPPAEASNLERIITWVGRSPDWSPPLR